MKKSAISLCAIALVALVVLLSSSGCSTLSANASPHSLTEADAKTANRQYSYLRKHFWQQDVWIHQTGRTSNGYDEYVVTRTRGNRDVTYVWLDRSDIPRSYNYPHMGSRDRLDGPPAELPEKSDVLINEGGAK